MAMFVHLALQSRLPRIRRAGLSRLRPASGPFPGGVFAVPVTADFVGSHQWLRELKRRGGGPLGGVYFRVPDRERVWVGRFAQPHEWMTAAEAVGAFLTEPETQGWEVVIPRRITPGEIHATRPLPQVLGWRYFPESHGNRPSCTCRYCIGGNYGARRLRERYTPPDR